LVEPLNLQISTKRGTCPKRKDVGFDDRVRVLPNQRLAVQTRRRGLTTYNFHAVLSFGNQILDLDIAESRPLSIKYYFEKYMPPMRRTLGRPGRPDYVPAFQYNSPEDMIVIAVPLTTYFAQYPNPVVSESGFQGLSGSLLARLPQIPLPDFIRYSQGLQPVGSCEAELSTWH
jgi:hypothetical protein